MVKDLDSRDLKVMSSGPTSGRALSLRSHKPKTHVSLGCGLWLLLIGSFPGVYSALTQKMRRRLDLVCLPIGVCTMCVDVLV